MNDFVPQIVAFYCSNCASAAADVAEGLNLELPDNVRVINVPCTGRIEILHLLKPFERGADGVYVAGCQEDSCRYTDGIDKVKKRVQYVKKILEQLEIEPQRIEVFSLSASKGQEFANLGVKMSKRVCSLGPNTGKD